VAALPNAQIDARGNFRVLVTAPDDERRNLASVLSRHGHETWEARDAREAIAWLRRRRDRGLAAPDALVLDARASYRSAVSLLTELRGAGAPPLVLVAPDAGGEAIDPELAREAAAIVEEPYTESALANALLLLQVRRLDEPARALRANAPAIEPEGAHCTSA
jgi:CheY-like chemotaxis protein